MKLIIDKAPSFSNARQKKTLICYLFRGYCYCPLKDFERLKKAEKITKFAPL